MKDELDGLTDAELNDLFGVEVVGWSLGRGHGLFWDAANNRSHYSKGGAIFLTRQKMNLPCEEPGMVDFAGDANAVLPYLQRRKAFHVYWDDHKMIVAEPTPSYHIDFGGRTWVRNAPTLARAICIALIRAARARKAAP